MASIATRLGKTRWVLISLASPLLAACGGGGGANMAPAPPPPAPTNTAPQIDGMPPASTNERDLFSFTFTATDAEGDALTFSVANAPAWLTIDPVTGELSGRPGAPDIGVAMGIVVSVSDGEFTTDAPAFDLEVIDVNSPPEILGRLRDVWIEDESLISQELTGQDVDGDTLTFSIINQPAWLTLDAATGEVSGQPTNDDVGLYPDVIASVTDGMFTATLDPVTIEVVNVNDTPSITGTPSLTVDEGQAYSFTPMASDVDVGDTLTFAVSNLPSWASFDEATGALSGTPGIDDAGEYQNIAVSVSDGEAGNGLAPFTITVVDVAAVTLSGQVTDAPVANAAVTATYDGETIETDADLDGRYSFTINRRDGAFDEAGLVTVRAVGTEAGQTAVELISVLGSFGELIAGAGTEQTLDASAFPRLNVTQLSTARSVLAPDFNDGVTPADATALAGAETAIPVSLLLDTAALIKAIVDDGLIPVPDGQSVLDLLAPAGDQSQREAIDAVLLVEGLVDVDGNPTPAFADALASARAATLADEGVVGGFDVASLTGVSLWADATAPGQLLRDVSARSVVELTEGGTGVLYRQRYEAIGFRGTKVRTDAIDVSWALSGQTLNLVADAQSAAEAAAVDEVELSDLSRLTEELGFDQEVVDFINQAITDGDTVPDPLEVNVVLVSRSAQALSAVATQVQALVEETREASLDAILTDLGWVGALPRGRHSVELTRVISPAVSDGAALADDVRSLQTWAIPVNYDLGASGGTPPGAAADLFTLRQDGRTTVGPLSGLDFAWNLVDGNLLLSASGDEMEEQYTYTRLAQDFNVDLVLVTYSVNGAVELRFVDWMARQRTTGVDLIDALVAPEPQFWLPTTGEPNFMGPRGDLSASYESSGLLSSRLLFGYLFRADLSAVLFEPGPSTCLLDDSRGCFETLGTWTYSASADAEQVSLLGDFAVFDRDITWELLDYDATASLGVVLEFEFSSFDDGEGGEVREVRAPPRINRVQLSTLDDYPVELQDARDVGFLED